MDAQTIRQAQVNQLSRGPCRMDTSQPTVSRWENAPTLREVVRLTYAMVDLYCASYPKSPEAVTLDAKTPAVELTGEVEIDEVYVVAGHKGQPAAVAKRASSDAVASWQARRAAARWRRTSRPSSA